MAKRQETDMAHEPAFGMDDYRKLIGHLDGAMQVLLELGKTEAGAQEMLEGFVLGHYLPLRQVSNPQTTKDGSGG